MFFHVFFFCYPQKQYDTPIPTQQLPAVVPVTVIPAMCDTPSDELPAVAAEILWR
jgi:hypothetical protein